MNLHKYPIYAIAHENKNIQMLSYREIYLNRKFWWKFVYTV